MAFLHKARKCNKSVHLFDIRYDKDKTAAKCRCGEKLTSFDAATPTMITKVVKYTVKRMIRLSDVE